MGGRYVIGELSRVSDSCDRVESAVYDDIDEATGYIEALRLMEQGEDSGKRYVIYELRKVLEP
jgi:hypothetical protein